MKIGYDYPGITVLVFATNRGRLLMHQRTDQCRDEHGRWDLGVGGALEAGESWDRCVIREAREEASLAVDPRSITFCAATNVLRETEEGTAHWVALLHHVRVNDEAAEKVKAAEPHKHHNLSWVSLGENGFPLPTHSCLPFHYLVMRQAILDRYSHIRSAREDLPFPYGENAYQFSLGRRPRNIHVALDGSTTVF